MFAQALLFLVAIAAFQASSTPDEAKNPTLTEMTSHQTEVIDECFKDMDIFGYDMDESDLLAIAYMNKSNVDSYCTVFWNGVRCALPLLKRFLTAFRQAPKTFGEPEKKNMLLYQCQAVSYACTTGYPLFNRPHPFDFLPDGKWNTSGCQNTSRPGDPNCGFLPSYICMADKIKNEFSWESSQLYLNLAKLNSGRFGDLQCRDPDPAIVNASFVPAPLEYIFDLVGSGNRFMSQASQ